MALKDRLPEDFIQCMHGQLPDETEAFLDAFEEEAYAGIRMNTRKLSASEAGEKLPFTLEKIPWTENGFYIDKNASAARHPYYYAGLYYLQEPSAMLPAAFLPVCPDDRVLDLCAAPGGKATELSSRLSENGLLVANDVSAGRAGALLKNLTIWGTPNTCITVETPQRLYDAFGCFFDKILVDAPCSGEGMFRKDSHLISSWKEKGPSYYAPLQKEILSWAVKMLRPGGMLLYSTCTFSTLEDEEVISDALQKNPELELVPLPHMDGFRQGFTSEEGIGPYPDCLLGCVRLYPHRIHGEGHFAALLRKKEDSDGDWPDSGKSRPGRNLIPKPVLDFFSTVSTRCVGTDAIPFLPTWHYEQIGEKCLLLPPVPLPHGIRYLRTGLLLGTLKNGRFEPSQALALLPDAPRLFGCLDLSAEDERVMRYLKGETLALNDTEIAAARQKKDGRSSDWVLVCVDGHGLGWGRIGGSGLKNKYYPGWRLQ
ncbi:MAG: RsmB/NOP family class I SAM-dependent RNA methyltransferase [Lachnospiraceae bacterium]|nr:RsmB/NOP family class I SAM-dependent RNA methyltransferase [Lachnospiraceae bacterium]